MKIRTLIVALLAAASRLFGAAAPTTAPTPPPFVIGVWQQPPANFPTWQARGCNTLVGVPTPATSWPPAAWAAAADAAKLWQVRAPIGAIATDTDPYVYAWGQPDEPEGTGVTAATCAANYAAWKKAQPNRKVFENFDGSRVLGIQGGLTQASYTPYLATADIFASDIYPVTGWGLQAAVPITSSGAAVRTLVGWTGGKPQFAFIETSNQNLGFGAPTAAQTRYEAWHAVLNGALGIIYFPQQIGVFAFDNTAPDVAAILPALNAEMTAVGPYLGGGLKYSALASGFEYGQADTAAGELRVLLNATAGPQSYGGVQFAPWGAYAVFVATSGAQTVIVQTPIPVPLDQQVTALQAQVNVQTQQLTALQAQMAAAAKALAPPTTQP